MRTALIVGLGLSVLVSIGCGGDKLSADQTAPFAKAIEEYLRAGSMGMKAHGFKSLEITGDKATAKVRMSDKDVGYGMKPLWTFQFEKSGDAWKVTNAER